MPTAAKRALITGISGFAGPYLANELVAAGYRVVGVDRPEAERPPDLDPAVELLPSDVRDSEELAGILADRQPSRVFHLAAISHVGESWNRQRLTLDINILGTHAVLDATARAAAAARVVLVSSGFVYGKAAPEDMPLSEEAPTRPVDPYSASKLCAEILAGQTVAARGLHVVIVRPFNFAGPGQDASFVCSDFARQVAWAEVGLSPALIRVGNVEAERDFTDVRDMVRGFALAAEASSGSTYNLSTGRGTRIRDLLDSLVAMADRKIVVEVDPERFRPSDVPTYVGDSSRARRELGWEPTIALRQTLADTLEYWRAAARAQPTSETGD